LADRAAGSPVIGDPPPAISSEAAAELARRHGLRQVGVRPPLRRYLRDTWEMRRFLLTLSSAESYAKNQNNHLGQLWAILNPLLLVASYFLVFGLLLKTDRGVGNFLAFLTIGIFLFGSTASSLTKGCRAIIGNLGLIRALQFPRCVLPLSVSITDFISNLPAFGVLLVLMLVTGERPTFAWIFFPAALAVHSLINTGIVLFAARMVNGSRDLANLVNMVTRLLRYVSGVFFSIDHYTQGHETIATILQYQPFALSLTLPREALLGEMSIHPLNWLVGLAWAILLPVAGLIFFWRGEATYGRG
jgi:teichoic acid transport system permease protein